MCVLWLNSERELFITVTFRCCWSLLTLKWRIFGLGRLFCTSSSQAQVVREQWFQATERKTESQQIHYSKSWKGFWKTAWQINCFDCFLGVQSWPVWIGVLSHDAHSSPHSMDYCQVMRYKLFCSFYCSAYGCQEDFFNILWYREFELHHLKKRKTHSSVLG